jgi:N-carbamoylputrescine amidase
MEKFFLKAAQGEPELVVMPEGVLEGYVIMDVTKHPEKGPKFLEVAETIDGPSIKHFQDLSRKLGIALCFGFAERVGDEAYNCAIFIEASGDICGKYHKTQFAEGYHPSWYFNRIGKKIRAFDTPFGRAGIVICNDRWNPMIARTLALDGAQFIMIPSYGSRSSSQNKAVLARSRENGIPIVEANVGVNLIVSRGEVVSYKWGCDRITYGEIDIPEPPSERAARSLEREYLRYQETEMRKRYNKSREKRKSKT